MEGSKEKIVPELVNEIKKCLVELYSHQTETEYTYEENEKPEET